MATETPSTWVDRADVKLVIADLLQDKVPSVRYMTTLAVGPEQHVKELEQLPQCNDRQVAEWATGKLKQILESKRKPQANLDQISPL